jgi:hypothetical protein
MRYRVKINYKTQASVFVLDYLDNFFLPARPLFCYDMHVLASFFFIYTLVGILALINYVIFNLLLKFTYISSLCWTLGTNFFTCTCWPFFYLHVLCWLLFLFTHVGLALTNYVTFNLLLNLSHKF